MPEGPDITLIVEYLQRYVGCTVSSVRYSDGKDLAEVLVGCVCEKIYQHSKSIYIDWKDTNTEEVVYVHIHLMLAGRLYDTYSQDKGHYFTLVFDAQPCVEACQEGCRRSCKTRSLSMYDHMGKAEFEIQQEPYILSGKCVMSKQVTRDDVLPWKTRSKYIITLLTEQDEIGGIGTQLAEEIVYKAKIHPARHADTLTEEEWNTLVKYMNEAPEWVVICGGFPHSKPVLPNGEKGYYASMYKLDDDVREVTVGNRVYRTQCEDPPGWKSKK